MDLVVKIEHPSGPKGVVQFRTPFDGEAISVERLFRRNGLSYERTLELVAEVEKFLVELGRRYEVSAAEAQQAEESAIHAATVVEIAKKRADEYQKREEEKQKADQARREREREAQERNRKS